MKLLLSIIFSLTTIIVYSQTNKIEQTGNVGIGTITPLSKLNIVHQTESSDKGALIIGNGSAPNLRFGYNTTYSWIQAHGTAPLYINELGNDLILNRSAGNVGIGTTTPTNKLDVRGSITIDNGVGAAIFTGTGTVELNRYLSLLNSTGLGSASGLKAGGILVSDAYAYANPGKNDLVVKGNVSVGTTSSQGHKLAVAGSVIAESVTVKLKSAWPDYVFEDNYKMKSLTEIEAFIKTNKHLPGMPNQKQVKEEGVNLGEMNRKLLEKVEELTLYLIQEKAAREEQAKHYGQRIENLEGKLRSFAVDKKDEK